MIDFTKQDQKNQIRERLTKSVLVLKFQLSNKRTVSLTGTCCSELIPSQDPTSHAGPPNNKLQVVWDLELNQWRSFRWERLIEVTDK